MLPRNSALQDIGLFAACFFFLSLGGINVIAEDSPTYPSSGFEKEKQITKSSGGTFWIEQWRKDGASPNGGQLYQTWLVPKVGSPVKLPEVKLSTDSKSIEDSGNVGFSSQYFLSPDNNYLFREQKVCRGNTGTYLYKLEHGLTYKVLFPHISEDASTFFSKLTGLKWYYGSGIVEFLEWRKTGEIVLTLRGGSEDRKYGVLGWRCLFSPRTGEYSVPEAWIQKNKKCIEGD